MIKPKESLLQPDERFKNMAGGVNESGGLRAFRIEDLYELVHPLELGPAVPDEIRQQFDTARYAFIYSWFAYDLVTLAESHCYGVLENALGLKAKQEGRMPRLGLKRRLDDAVNWGWLTQKDFEMPLPWGKTISILDLARRMRNRLAHGTAHLFPMGSLGMMQQCGLIITKLFPSVAAPK